jgi:sentrin-specific protease 1
MEYMSHEMKERKNEVLEIADWSLENVRGIPEQENGSDCGMFTCKFAECLARESKLDFVKQQNMNYYRERMIYELLKKDLMFP